MMKMKNKTYLNNIMDIRKIETNRKENKIMKENTYFESLCRLTQKEMKNYLSDLFPNSIKGDGYLYVPGTFPVMLLAHMDTVHKEVPKEFIYDGNIISSPQGIGGDDRCGIYMILKVREKYNCAILFTEDEEIGCKGAGKFCKSELAKELNGKFNYLIQLDRRGSDDAVFYECDNDEFTDFITEKDWTLNYGSYTDICEVGPELNAAAVNFSCGYYHEHHLDESVNLDEMETNIQRVLNTLERTDLDVKYEYMEKKHSRYNDWYGYGYNSSCDFGNTYYISYFEKGKLHTEDFEADSIEQAVGTFLMLHVDMKFSDIVEIFDDFEECNYSILNYDEVDED